MLISKRFQDKTLIEALTAHPGNAIVLDISSQYTLNTGAPDILLICQTKTTDKI
ncbi:MAG TPA: hypothetical protein VF623_10895 [Segetibacter sp.]